MKFGKTMSHCVWTKKETPGASVDWTILNVIRKANIHEAGEY